MRDQKFRKYSRCGYVTALALALMLGSGGTAVADTPQAASSTYSVSGVQIGGNGSTQSVCSGGQYCASESVGDIVNGGSSSTNYSATSGSETPDQPVLEVSVTGGIQNMGVLDTTTTGTAAFGVSVLTYLSNGYTLFISGAAPSQGSHTLKVMDPDAAQNACPCTSQPGAEQFGMNLADNSAPDIGANEVQIPSSDFSFGHVAGETCSGQPCTGASGFSFDHNYSQPDLFLYKDGDAIAGSSVSSGETDYTISMIINVSGVTPGGRYTGTYSAIAVPVF